jgi:hypothetical protein
MSQESPSLATPNTDRPVDLDTVVADGDARIMICPSCRHRQVWSVNDTTDAFVRVWRTKDQEQREAT